MALFGLDTRGNLQPKDDEARAALQSYGGDLALLPTSPDLLLLIRAQPLGEKGVSPRVVLAGDASGFPVSDLIAFLAQSRWSGTLRVHAPTGQRSIWLREGEVRGATSELSIDRLGEVVTRMGYVKRTELEALMRDTPPSRLGRALVERGMLQAHDLYKCITQQVSDIFHAMVLCREGAFVLLDQEGDERSVQGLQLSTQSLLMDSVRKVDEMAYFRKRIPHSRLYVVRKRESDGSLEAEEDLVLSQVNGQLTIQELGQEAKLSEFDVTKVVFRLLEGGFAQVTERPAVPIAEPATAASSAPVAVTPSAAAAAAPAGPPGRDAPSLIATFNEIFREIFSELHREGKGADFLATANAALGQGGLTESPVIRGVTFAASGELPEATLVARYEAAKAQLGSQPLAALRQALSDVMFFLLFQAGELLETRADEDLARRVKLRLATLD